MKATVVLPNDSYPIEIDARDRRAFEREAQGYFGQRGVGALQDVAKAMPETYLAWLSWHACKRQLDGFTMAWPKFEADLLEVQADDAESSDDGLDPTQPTASAG